MINYREILVIIIVFSSLSVYAASDDTGIFCEPSLIFSELSFLEEERCFSHTLANTVYDSSSTLKKYLDRFPDNPCQNGYRYFYYLRESSFLPAIVTLLHMVNTETLPASINDSFKELNNTLMQGIKTAGATDFKKNIQPFGDDSNPKTIEVLESEFFSLLSYVASYASQYSAINNDSTIIFRTMSILLSNIASGINWEEDTFLHKRFNDLVVIKNQDLLENYISLFFFYARGDDFNLPSFSKYLQLKEKGVVSDMTKAGSFSEGSSVRKIIARFFIDNFHKMPDVVIVKDLPETVDKERKKVCRYLKKRTEWLASVPNIGEDVLFFNEAAKIVEQCGGSLSFPFLIDGDRIYILKDSLWLIDIAVSLRYLMLENISVRDGNTVLRGAVKASLEKAAEREKSSLDEEFLLYSLKIGKSAEVLRSFFAIFLPAGDGKNESENINDAAFFLSKILF
ncbi:MAG TPA: hypothetical protein ENN58_04290 [bacterium]|nr:hypothetical protein [bacterium]